MVKHLEKLQSHFGLLISHFLRGLGSLSVSYTVTDFVLKQKRVSVKTALQSCKFPSFHIHKPYTQQSLFHSVRDTSQGCLVKKKKEMTDSPSLQMEILT